MKRTRMPVLFIGHGSPMNAIEDNPWSRGFRKLASILPAPRAILAVSAHWFGPGTQVTGNHLPETIHDFGGFPRALFEVRYPASGDPGLAARLVDLLTPARCSVSNDWGLDHGTWTVLHHLYPGADCPVVQLSIDQSLSLREHLELGRTLVPLREEGVLIMGSGNITHNLRAAGEARQQNDASTPAWASQFDADVARALEQGDMRALVALPTTEHGLLAHPSPDHYIPLLYAAGAAQGARVGFPIAGFDSGSLSMRSALFA